MGKIVLVDTQILIWGLKGVATPGQEQNIEDAKLFISWLSRNNFILLMPTPQIAELLSYVPPEKQAAIRSLFDKRFMVVPFDEMAAFKCAELIYLSLNTEELIKYRLEHRVFKNKIKYDCMLAAIAIVRGASQIFSQDTDMRKFANGQIEVANMPKIEISPDSSGNK